MDAFEWNKIFGAVIAGALIIMVISTVSETVFHEDPLEKPAYTIEVASAAPVEAAAEENKEPGLVELLASASVDKGEKQFAKCKACHTVDKGGRNGLGPNLYAIVGRTVGGFEGFKYSAALADHGGAWDYELLDAWLASPKEAIAGNKMMFAGLGKPGQRADLIAYMRSLADTPAPLPAAAEEDKEPSLDDLLATASADKGEKQFAKCKACHSVDKGGRNGLGPNLYEIVGRTVGGFEGYKYSAALADHGGTWDYALLDAWLANPKDAIAGNKMMFAGLGKPGQRADLIAYMRSLADTPAPMPGGE